MGMNLKRLDYIFFAIVILIVSFGCYATFTGSYGKVTAFGADDYEEYVYISTGGGMGGGGTMHYSGAIQNKCKRPLTNIFITFKNPIGSTTVMIEYLNVGERMDFDYTITGKPQLVGMLFVEVESCYGEIVYDN